MILWSASRVGKFVLLLGVLVVSVCTLTGTPANGQAAKAPATSAAPPKKTIAAPEGKYRDVVKDDGLECNIYTSMISSLSNPTSGTLRSAGRTFECDDASGKSREIGLVAMHDLKDKRMAIITKAFGTIYYRTIETCVPSPTERTSEGEPVNYCSTKATCEMTDIQIKKLKSFLGL